MDSNLSSNSCSNSNSNEKTVEENSSTEVDLSSDFSTPEKQEARAFLRERFLRVITGIVGRPAKVQMYENTNVSAEFRGCDIDFLELYVRNLTTPLGQISDAILRTSDVIHIELDKV